jgi:hypothetical protein
MSYRDYQRMLGLQLPQTPAGVTFKDYKVDEAGSSWYATLYLKDGAPLLLQLYVWSGGLEAVWERVGHGTPDDVDHRGNGHFTAAWRLPPKVAA